jgi:ankyrin repeat protein
MKAIAHALIELSLLVAAVAVVWADPAPVSNFFAVVSQDERLVEAARLGDDARFDDALRRGALVSARDGCGATALHYAALDGDVYLVRRLIALGAEVDVRTHGGTTPMWNAAINDHAEVVQILLRAGAAPSDEVLEVAMVRSSPRAEQLLRDWRARMEADE